MCVGLLPFTSLPSVKFSDIQIKFLQEPLLSTRRKIVYLPHHLWSSQVLRGKDSTCNSGDTGDVDSIPGSERSPASDNLLQYSCPENSTARGAWWAMMVHGITKSGTGLSD